MLFGRLPAAIVGRRFIGSGNASYPGLAGPVVRILLAEYQLDGREIVPSGPRNALLKVDVMRYIRSRELLQKPSAHVLPACSRRSSRTFIDVPVSKPVQTKVAVPHGYLSIVLNLSDLMSLKEESSADCQGLSTASLFVRAACLALKRIPRLNAHSDGDNLCIVPEHHIAVNIPSNLHNNFVLMRNAHAMTIGEIDHNLQTFRRNAAGPLGGDSCKEATFTVCNMSDHFLSDGLELVRPPQVATLTLGALYKQASETGNACQTLCKASLAFNNALIDEEMAGNWLDAFAKLLANPFLLC